jgi:hypothetical protein
VAKPGALVAVWGYNLLRVDDEVDEILNHFYTHVVGPYWDPARKLVDDQYQHIEFPFAELKLPPFFIPYEWTLAQLHGYITTWSAVQQYMRVQGNNPVDALAAALSPHWRGARQVVFPIFLRTGKVEKSV